MAIREYFDNDSDSIYHINSQAAPTGLGLWSCDRCYKQGTPTRLVCGQFTFAINRTPLRGWGVDISHLLQIGRRAGAGDFSFQCKLIAGFNNVNLIYWYNKKGSNFKTM